nr:phytanoyl-CoA dioxygenase family protein [Brevifollis gellanilyticus]
MLTSAECTALADLLGAPPSAGRRGLLSVPEIRHLAASEKLLTLVRPHLPTEPFAVRGIYFDKSPDTNWLVSWHQDLTICVQEKREVPGFGPWSVKEGVPHVQPPVEVLESMLTIRLHLDDTDETNGALRVIPGSHKLGRLGNSQIQPITASGQESMCIAPQGAALLIRPLILHSSSRSTSTRRRRVIHLEYACTPLDAGLEWQEA